MRSGIREAFVSAALFLAVWTYWTCFFPQQVQAETLCQTQILSQEQREEFLAPQEEYRDQKGNIYDLTDWEITVIEGKSGWREIEREVIYSQVEAAKQIPHSIPYTEQVGNQEVKGELVEAGREVTGEQWSGDLQIPLTFHSYGAGSYMLGNLTMEVLEEFPPASEYQEQLLGILGLPLSDYEILRMEWRGEPYQDENGELCRDAAALGNKKLRDYRVVYRGELAWPEPDSYELKTFYRRRENSKVSLAQEESAASEVSEEPAESRAGFWIQAGAMVTIAIGLLGIALGLLILGLLRLRERRKN